MKAYKGFNSDLTCRGFQFEEGKEYHEDIADLCNSGFHACEAPLDCFSYYSPNNSVYHVVELDEVSERRSHDSKICGKHIKIGASVSIAELCALHIEYVRSRCTHMNAAENGELVTAGDHEAATAGVCGAATADDYGTATAGIRGAATAGICGAATAGIHGTATAGDRGAAIAGYHGAATAGNFGAAIAGTRGVATAGNCGAATAGVYGLAATGNQGVAAAGKCGVATTGNHGVATAGNFGAAIAGNYGAAISGNRGTASSRGASSVGVDGIALSRGVDVKVKGGLGSILVIAEEDGYDGAIKEWKAEVVDGERIKADTWYALQYGEFVEVPEDEE